MQSKTVGPGIVREVVADLDPSPKPHHRASSPQSVAAASAEPATLAVEMPASPVWDSWAIIPSNHGRRSRTKGIAILACVALPLLLVFIFSNPKLGLTSTPPGKLSGQVVNAVLNSSDPASDFVPPLPNGLKPPSAPAIQPTIDTSNAKAADDTADDTSEEESDGTAPPENSPAVKPARMAPVANKAVVSPIDRVDREPLPTVSQRKTAVVQVSRRENLFEFALENYGKSSRTIVDDICRSNPQLRGPYDMLAVGEWIQLPSEPSTLTADSGAR